MTVGDLHEALRTHFRLESFRPGQEDSIEAVLAGRDVVAVLPTGGGKTLVYQMAGRLLEGTTIVATPLIALMQDQVRRVRTDDLRVEELSGDVRGERRADLLDELRGGSLDFLFSTPEQLAREDVRSALRESVVALFVVDEAHCISEWGYDFRPAYRELSDAIVAMGHPPVLAMTATAPEAVRRDVASELHLDDPVLVARGFDRSNLHFGVIRVPDPERRDRQLVRALSEIDVPAVVYCSTRRETEEAAQALLDLGAVDRRGRVLRIGHYHGGMDRAARDEAQTRFLDDDLDVLCATSAFGMGIDKPDIRTVLHRTMPDSLESYWQESGRAGRDGEPADCILAYREQDRAVHEHLHRRSRPAEPTVAKMIHVASQADGSDEDELTVHIADSAEVARSGVVALLEDLHRFGYLVRDDRGITWHGESSAAMEDIADHHEAQVEVEASRLQMVASYAETTTCRRRYLLNYLGDEYDAELCLRCDNCLRIASRRGIQSWDLDEQRARVDVARSGPFSVGADVQHAEWGRGSVQRVEGDVVVVRFDDVGYRSMHVPTIVERGLLQSA